MKTYAAQKYLCILDQPAARRMMGYPRTKYSPNKKPYPNRSGKSDGDSSPSADRSLYEALSCPRKDCNDVLPADATGCFRQKDATSWPVCTTTSEGKAVREREYAAGIEGHHHTSRMEGWVCRRPGRHDPTITAIVSLPLIVFMALFFAAVGCHGQARRSAQLESLRWRSC